MSRIGEEVESAIEAVRRSLRTGQIVAFTGAGISAESHVPTFRGADGLWRNYSPEKLATAEAFERDPHLVWEWYDWLRGLIHAAQPNPGHLALTEMQRRAPGKFTLVTQNMDGLHEIAGSQDVVKLHGDIWRLRCTSCGREGRNEQTPMEHLPPLCRCGGTQRPAIVWFGEMLPVDQWDRAMDASRTADIFMAIGTSASVYPAAGLVQVARQSGARVVIVNPDPTPADELATWILRGPAGEILPRLI
ncbi:MAG: SIR2 family NAD-dependent protein deacylase [Terriglobia bacterium]